VEVSQSFQIAVYLLEASLESRMGTALYNTIQYPIYLRHLYGTIVHNYSIPEIRLEVFKVLAASEIYIAL